VSLILDALRRAEAERERGSVPGLHSHPAPEVSDADAPRSRIEPWHWMVIGVGIGILVAAVWYVVGMLAAQQEAQVTGTPPAVAATAPVAATTSPPAPSPATSTALEAPPPASVAPSPAAPPTADVPVAEPAPWPAGDRRSEPRKAADASARPAAKGAAAAAAAAAPETPLYTREQLPDGIRGQFPAMTFGGSMYSANAANRSLIINGQIHRENDLVTPDLSIEQIRVKGAVFRFKGYRVEVPY
jgi:general secretion pathway protein B